MIRADHISKTFDGREVLKDITVEFDTGKTNLIIGRSGSGKTVLLKSLVGLHEVDKGLIYFDDTCYTKLGFKERKEIRKDIGMIFQGGALLDSSTVRENVRLPLDLFTTMTESALIAPAYSRADGDALMIASVISSAKLSAANAEPRKPARVMPI